MMLLKSVTAWAVLTAVLFRNQVRNGLEAMDQNIDSYANGSFYMQLSLKFSVLFGIGSFIGWLMMYDISNYLDQKCIDMGNDDNSDDDDDQNGDGSTNVSESDTEDNDSTYVESNDVTSGTSDVSELVRTQSYDDQMLREHFQRSDSGHTY